MTMKTTALIGVFVVFVSTTTFGEQDALSTAKDLYASAAFEDALTALARIPDSGSASDITRQADQYRVFCLVALGRMDEAKAAAETIVRRDPLVQLDPAAASPRIEELFKSVRSRLLPALIRSQYGAAKSALDQKRLAEAEPQLLQARVMLAEAEKIGVWDESLADLSVLVDGFLDLIRAKTDVPSPIAVANSAAPTPTLANSPSNGSTAVRTEPVAPPSSNQPRVYSLADEGVTPPVVLSQEMPPIPTGMLRILSKKRGVFDVIVDDTGAVQQIVAREPMSAVYDQLVQEAARRWRYRPARKNGVPVAYTKTIVVTAKD